MIASRLRAWFRDHHKPRFSGLEILKYIGPGMLVTVGFIDPGNWAANVAAGAGFGYSLLWMVTLATLMLIVLQHNAAHLGIATGLCLSEAAVQHMRPLASRSLLGSAMIAAVATALAELLGAAIALNMLFGLPIWLGTLLTTVFVAWMLYSNAYRRIEKIIIAFVSLIGLSFIYELTLVKIPWGEAAVAWVTPSFPHGSIPIIMSVLGAVVMPHNLFLHSEVIQSRQWNLENKDVIKHQLRFEFVDTLFSMLVGWGINSAMILVAAATFFAQGTPVDQLEQAQAMLRPILGDAAAVVFALALLMAGLSSSVTAGMAGGSIFAGIFSEPFDIKDPHSRLGVALTLVPAALCILLITSPFQGLVVSQILLSIQLPLTIYLQFRLTASRKVMGEFVNTAWHNFVLGGISIVVVGLNMLLLWDTFFG
ncbi:MAG: Nramp family divalent metal transporter [Humidesulfovibrio sp.]|uniref:Nramp family divalent metal transporter n=1 Tax=Humidesulfovibrio sp. TaxID=2910988 RepID=UPI0027F0F8C9|nr:Nramp family divalent metal transporter [Humidesulfovibrio sp.]MDQ7833812.1 Nramp family divalent metal transporter [Humidesulfovibrio sp.]